MSDIHTYKESMLMFEKGITSRYAPLSAVLTRTDLSEDLDDDGFVHGYTFSDHPVACAAAMANLDILERENLPGNAYRQGRRLVQLLNEGLANCSIFGKIRDKGLLLSIELVHDRKTMNRFQDPFSFAVLGKAVLGKAVLGKPIFIKHKILCQVGPQIRLGAPLFIADAEADALGCALIATILEIEQRVLNGALDAQRPVPSSQPFSRPSSRGSRSNPQTGGSS